ncbi:MAG: S16 family serine protease [Acidilobaceae archaeon]
MVEIKLEGFRKLLAAYMLLLILGATLASQSQLESYSQTLRELSGWVLVPAVRGSQGTLVNVTVQLVYPGSGAIRVAVENERGEIGKITRLSMELAVRTASLLAGYSWRSFDANITIHITTDITGPSGGVAIALLTYSLLSLNSNSSIAVPVTGAVTPHGLASRVGGIPEKCVAAMSGGMILVMPLANTAEAPQTCRYLPVAGVLDASEKLGVIDVPSVDLRVDFSTLHPKLDSLLSRVAEDLSAKTESILSELPPPLKAEVSRVVAPLLEEASSVREKSPYTASSIAFSAYIRALQAKYSYALSREGRSYAVRVLESLKSEASSIELKLRNLQPDNSQLYVEFASLAYARLADAVYHIGLVEANIDRLKAEDLAFRLAYISGRLETSRLWVAVAEDLRGEGLKLSEYAFSDLLTHLRDFARIAADYAVEVVNYSIRYYPLDEDTKRYMSSIALQLREISRLAEAEYARENRVAALGYYRECLSKALDITSQLLAGDDRALRLYYEELQRSWLIAIARLSAKGLSPGVSYLYYEYASYRASRGDYGSALDLMEDAVLSAMLWSMAALSYLARPYPDGSIETSQARAEVALRQAIMTTAWTLLLLATGLACGVGLSTIAVYLSLRRRPPSL